MDKIRTRIVDEAWLMRKIVERSLPQACIDLEKVVGATNRAEGLGALRAHQVDLCDINLPVMDGRSLSGGWARSKTARGARGP
jgi:CheY-like chemotaxis protein